MSAFLARVGRFSAGHRLLVVGAWLLILASLIGLPALSAGSNAPEGAQQSTSDTDAARTLDRVKEEFPALAKKSEVADTLQLVFEAPNNGAVTDPATSDAIARLLSQAAGLPGVTAVSNPLDPANPEMSQDESLAVATLSYAELGDTAQKEAHYQAALDLREYCSPRCTR